MQWYMLRVCFEYERDQTYWCMRGGSRCTCTAVCVCRQVSCCVQITQKRAAVVETRGAAPVTAQKSRGPKLSDRHPGRVILSYVDVVAQCRACFSSRTRSVKSSLTRYGCCFLYAVVTTWSRTSVASPPLSTHTMGYPQHSTPSPDPPRAPHAPRLACPCSEGRSHPAGPHAPSAPRIARP